MKKLAILISLLLTLLISLSLFAYSADNRGLAVNIKQLGQDNPVGKQWVVLIAVNKYKNLNPLKNPVKDAEEIGKILKSKYYVDQLIELYDESASKKGIIDLFKRLKNEVNTHDSLMIFYAGHGYLDKDSNTGFWMPYDAGTDTSEQDNWLTNQQIRGYLSNMKSRHILLVSDSCFSGDILNSSRSISAPKINNEYFSKAYSKISRQVLTSGASETVPDDSSFAMQFKLALEGNSKPYIDPLTMFNEIRSGVKGTTPMFGDLKNTGHQEGGSFLLFLKSNSSESKNFEEKQVPVKVVSKTAEPKNIVVTVERSYGKLKISAKTLGDLYIDSKKVTKIASGDTVTLSNIQTGEHILEMKYKNYSEKQEVEIEKNLTKDVDFTWKQASIETKPKQNLIPTPKPKQNSNFKKPLPIPIIKNNEMVLVKAGTFDMGDTFGVGEEGETPVHKVTLTYDYYIGKYEVIQREYEFLMGNNPSNWIGKYLPVERVSWFDAIEYCNALSKTERLPLAYNKNGDLLDSNRNVTTDITKVKGYRLPTEAEWEYAAREGKNTKGYKYSGSNNINEVGWYFDNSRNKTHEVGMKQPNELGIYDMSGNVWEWCTDWDANYTISSVKNPYIYKGSDKVERGGSWKNNDIYVRISLRSKNEPSYSRYFLGFRVARTK